MRAYSLCRALFVSVLMWLSSRAIAVSFKFNIILLPGAVLREENVLFISHIAHVGLISISYVLKTIYN